MKRRSDRILRLIALFRWSKALVLVATALGVLRLLHPGATRLLANWVLQFPMAAQHRFLADGLARLTHLDPTRIEWIAAGLFGYAALFTVEGYGLWRGRRWGEWLTIVATSSFVPFELYELFRRATALRAAFLLVNVVIVIYLLWRIRAGD